MAKIKFGKQKHDSVFNLDMRTSGSSSTEISFGDQEDRSSREVKITDLPSDINMERLASDLASIIQQTGQREGPRDSSAKQALSSAQAAALAGDRTTARQFLEKAGIRALHLAESIGASVAVAAIKSTLGLK